MLSNAESLRTAIFIGLVGSVYAIGLWFLLESRRRSKENLSISRRFFLMRRFVYVLAIIGILCFAYGKFVEPTWLKTSHIELQSNSLPMGSKLRIMHLSDLHSVKDPLNEPKIPVIARNERPDLIVFTGDLKNNPSGLPTAQKLFCELSQIAPTYAILGNWDTRFDYLPDFYKQCGVKLLQNEVTAVQVRGNLIQIVGMSSDNDSAAPRIVQAADSRNFTILLVHSADQIVPVAATRHVNLYLAGHTHGGQIAMPFYGALVTLSRTGKQYEAGLYRVDDTYLYVSRGIGLEGGSAPRVRFASRPEVVILDIAGTGK